MKKIYAKFYIDFYSQTGGFIPLNPLGQNIYPGDFFQIRNGEIITLGNIYMNNIISVEDCSISETSKLNEANWNFASGVTKPYTRREVAGNMDSGKFEFRHQVLKFKDFGSYIFHSKHPESIVINNWSYIRDELIIKLTQTQFSFREVYIATEAATTNSWTLAVAGSENAELEIAAEEESAGIVELFGHESSKTIQSKDIEYYNRSNKRSPIFFKAKKLAVKEEMLNDYLNDLINQRESVNNWADKFYDYNFEYNDEITSPQVNLITKASVLDLLSSGELNPNTALQYFRWTDANLDDVNKLFPTNE